MRTPAHLVISSDGRCSVQTREPYSTASPPPPRAGRRRAIGCSTTYRLIPQDLLPVRRGTLTDQLGPSWSVESPRRRSAKPRVTAGILGGVEITRLIQAGAHGTGLGRLFFRAGGWCDTRCFSARRAGWHRRRRSGVAGDCSSTFVALRVSCRYTYGQEAKISCRTGPARRASSQRFALSGIPAFRCAEAIL